MVDVAGDLPVTAAVVIPAAELRWAFSRGTGPGGQSVNTADSRVELRWRPADSAALTETQQRRIAQRCGNRMVDGDLVVRAAEHRSQWQNRRAARERLAELVRQALRPPPPARRRSRPTRAAVERRLQRKRRRGEVKQRRTRPAADD
jgi:ribosome-associated protein